MERASTTRRLAAALALAILVLGAALVGVGTYSYFTDTETSDSNTVEAGTLDLTLDGTNGHVSGSFSLTNAGPGESVSHNFTLRNVGTKPADHVEVRLSTTENDAGRSEPADSSLAAELGNVQTQQYIEVVTYEYRNDGGMVTDNLLSGVTDANGNGIVDLAEVINQTNPADGLPAPQANAGNSTELAIELRIANDDGGAFTGTDEDVMADGVDVALEFRLNQVSSQ